MYTQTIPFEKHIIIPCINIRLALRILCPWNKKIVFVPFSARVN